MHMRSLLIVLLAVLAGCDLIGTDSNDSEHAPEIYREYTKSVVRESDSELEEKLIERAEAAYPPRDSVLKVVPSQRRDFIPKDGYWFYSSFDGVLIPYAITREAVDYYSDLIDALKSGDELQFITKADLRYFAKVDFHEEYVFDEKDPRTGRPLPEEVFNRVYVVQMTLEWSQYCGLECAMWIDQSRLVLFDQSGELLRIFRDGRHPVAVS